MSTKYRSIVLIVALVAGNLCSSPVSGAEDAFALYGQKKYAAAADSFERLMKTSLNARTLYYAALANRACNREGRAKQLFQYVATNFPTTQEASYAKQALGSAAAATATAATGNSAATAGTPDDLPESVKAALSPEMRAMLDTPEGKAAIMAAMKNHAPQAAAIRQAERKGSLTTTNVKAAVKANEKGELPPVKEHPYTAADIAKLGPKGIDQSMYPNCWFEAAMSALAGLPRGQRLLADMIHGKDALSYVVKFPGDGHEYTVSHESIVNSGIENKALWASIIECAQLQKYPWNEGAQGPGEDQSRLEVGMQCITGKKAEIIEVEDASPAQLSSFIGGAVKSGNPIVAGTEDRSVLRKMHPLVFPNHAYTIIGFEPAKNLILMRNPHGQGSREFELKSDPNHFEFEQLEDGKFKMSVAKFKQYFYSVARSFI